MAGAKRQRIAKRIRVRYPEEDESGRPRPDLRAEADVTSAHKGLSDRGFLAVWSAATERNDRRARCNRALQTKSVEDFKAVWSAATRNKDPVIKGVKPGLEYGEWLSRI